MMMIEVKSLGADKYRIELGDKCTIWLSVLSFLSKSVHIQFQLHDRLSQTELRWMHGKFPELVEGTTAVCNVMVDDPIALRFAEYFGFKIVNQVSEVYVLKRVS